MSKVKKYLIDLLVGFSVGLVVLIGQLLFTNEFSFIGGEAINNAVSYIFRDNSILTLFLGGVLYVLIISIIPFIIYVLLPFYKKYRQTNFNALFFSFLFFSLGVYIVFLILILGALYAISQGDFIV